MRINEPLEEPEEINIEPLEFPVVQPEPAPEREKEPVGVDPGGGG